jgi:hypothetical protein
LDLKLLCCILLLELSDLVLELLLGFCFHGLG